jgi:hypothetical protein
MVIFYLINSKNLFKKDKIKSLEVIEDGFL